MGPGACRKGSRCGGGKRGQEGEGWREEGVEGGRGGGGEGGGDILGWGHTRILGKAPAEAYKNKPQQTIQKKQHIQQSPN